MNIRQILDMIPGDGYKSIIGSVALMLFGIGGLISGKVEQGTAIEAILAGFTALGISHKQMKIADTTVSTEAKVEKVADTTISTEAKVDSLPTP